MKSLAEFIHNIIYYGLESIGKYYSSYRGYVLDNVDEENLGRIKVKIPSITRNQEHPSWAYPKTQIGGKNYGLHVLPRKGDIVWIEFEHGDTRFPIWSFGHRAKNELPEEFSSPKIYGFKTPSGQIIIMNDETGEIVINKGDNEGLVKVVELTDKLNNIENKVNSFLAHYRTHQVIDPISGIAGPLNPAPPAPVDLITTQQSEIENDKVKH